MAATPPTVHTAADAPVDSDQARGGDFLMATSGDFLMATCRRGAFALSNADGAGVAEKGLRAVSDQATEAPFSGAF